MWLLLARFLKTTVADTFECLVPSTAFSLTQPDASKSADKPTFHSVRTVVATVRAGAARGVEALYIKHRRLGKCSSSVSLAPSLFLYRPPCVSPALQWHKQSN